MLKDFLLASMHHLLAFGLVAMLVSESVLLSRPLDSVALKRLAGIDRGYGIVAVLLVVGLWRVCGGVNGAGFYLHNPWFHAGFGAFVLAALLSAWPTIRFLKWRAALKNAPGFPPTPAEAAGLRCVLRIELALVAAILVCVAGMVRHGGLHLWDGTRVADSAALSRRTWRNRLRRFRLAAQDHFFEAIQRSIFPSSTSSGTAPSFSTSAWNSRMSNLPPSSFSAFARNSLIFNSPLLYASAWPGHAM